ncbi:uncharacterized protein RCC_04104 [Ramularia collo-cygni]|uniref:Uncharacterized protein n=1 Tax=Ramularia collo-cygni TaxID=112498 RepID=A0A2D3V9Q7_9PEZI|nr:uncharacterized protein RCC_04104 [Ramularia collo-cygni]CZT18259.1 uncharacterized protein RCC_04104 [Ramularia collo-cygni]
MDSQPYLRSSTRTTPCQACLEIYYHSKSVWSRYIWTATHILDHGVSLCCPDTTTTSNNNSNNNNHDDSRSPFTRARSITSEISELDLNESGVGQNTVSDSPEDASVNPQQDTVLAKAKREDKRYTWKDWNWWKKLSNFCGWMWMKKNQKVDAVRSKSDGKERRKEDVCGDTGGAVELECFGEGYDSMVVCGVHGKETGKCDL